MHGRDDLLFSREVGVNSSIISFTFFSVSCEARENYECAVSDFFFLSKLASSRNSNYVTVFRCTLKVSHLWHDYRSNY